MRDWTQSTSCAARAHCRTCRDLAGGRAWRQSLTSTFALPADGPDFACPHGLPWGHDPGPVEIVARPAARPPKPAISKRYAEVCSVCEACKAKSDCPVWKLSPCNRSKALAGDPRYPCPEGKWELVHE